MNVTVVLCTYNRAESLTRTLNSAATLTVPEWVKWEILVVDNNSSDHTPDVCAEFCRRYPGRFRYLFERQQGLSCARNAGVRKSAGEIIVFTDDDVTFEPTWLQNLTAGLSDHQYAGAGGRVLPLWTCSPPGWLPVNLRYGLGPLTVFDLGPKAGELKEPPLGANMAFRRAMFEKYRDFRTDLGRRPGSLIGNEDTEFGRRLLASGERLRYEPSAVVYHPVQEERIRKEYFLSWWFDKARADILESGIPPDIRWSIGGIPLYLFPRLAVWTLRWVITADPSLRFSRKINTWKVTGQIFECFRLSLGKRRNCTEEILLTSGKAR